MKLAIDTPFLVIQDPQGKGLFWFKGDDETVAWDLFSSWDRRHKVVDWTDWDADEGKRGAEKGVGEDE